MGERAFFENRALDGENEKLVTNTIYHDVNKNRDKTIIMITHRRESIMQCDRLYVLNKGECIEEGSFDSLMKKKGYFYNLFNTANSIVCCPQQAQSRAAAKVGLSKRSTLSNVCGRLRNTRRRAVAAAIYVCILHTRTHTHTHTLLSFTSLLTWNNKQTNNSNNNNNNFTLLYHSL